MTTRYIIQHFIMSRFSCLLCLIILLSPSFQATENLTSTNFEILRPATIESDNNEHKVSICQLEFSPQFEYTAIPKSVAHAFLKVKVTNESSYALLAGDASVFLDNNFLTKVF